MAIPIVEPIIWRQLPTTSAAAMRDAVIKAMKDAGWTEDAVEAILQPYSILTITDLPNNGGTVTVGTKTYTWRTTLSSGGSVGYEVMIGFDQYSAAQNLAAAIASGPGAGLVYGWGTSPHPDVTVSQPSGDKVRVEGISSDKYGLATSKNCNNAAWEYPFLANISTRLLSVPTEQDGLQYAARVFLPWVANVNCIGIQIENSDGTITSAWNAGWYNSYYNGMLCGMHPKCLGFPEIIVHGYGAIIFYRGSAYGYGSCWWQTVQLPLESAPGLIEDAVTDLDLTITGADNTGAGGDVRITSAAHGYSDGEKIHIAGLTGLPDGDYPVTRVDGDHFDLNGTAAYAVSGNSGSAIRDASILVYQPGHNYINGNNVTVTNPPRASETLDLRGQWQIQVLDGDYYRLVGSRGVAAAPYDPEDKIRAGGPGQCTQVMFCSWDNWNDMQQSNRTGTGFVRGMGQWPLVGDSRSPSWPNESGEVWCCYQAVNFWDANPNQFGDSNAGGYADVQMYGVANLGGRSWFGSRYQIFDAVVGWSVEGYTKQTVASGVGFLFNTMIVTKDLPMDLEVLDDEGKRWIVISKQRSDLQISILMRVPQGYN
jgi:hypothetical protein